MIPATIVQFVVGWQFYRGAYKQFARGQREHGCFDRDGLFGRLFFPVLA